MNCTQETQENQIPKTVKKPKTVMGATENENLITVKEFATRMGITDRRVGNLIRNREIICDFVNGKRRVDWGKYRHFKPSKWSADHEYCSVCLSTDRRHHAGGMCHKCYDKTRRGDRWHHKYDACVACGFTEAEHKARGLCVLCYKRERDEFAILYRVVVDLGSAGKLNGESDMVRHEWDDELGVNVVLELSASVVWFPIGCVRVL